MTIASKLARGRRLCSVAAFVILSLSMTPALAQRVVPEVPTPGGAGMGGAAGVGGGAGLTPAMPDMRSAPMAAPAPQVAPAIPAAPAAPQAVPVAPAAPVVKFRCQLDPGAETCREPGAADGGGDDDACNCARDYCYDDPAGFRVCQKQ